MILASHIVVSGLLGTTTKNYFLAAIFGLGSHYLLDGIPHWDFYCVPEKKFSWKEMGKVVIDILIGLSLLFAIFIALKNPYSQNIFPILISVFFGALPDALQLLYWMTKWQPIKWNYDLQQFMHYSIHKKIDQNFWHGIAIQIATIGIVFLILYKF